MHFTQIFVLALPALASAVAIPAGEQLPKRGLDYSEPCEKYNPVSVGKIYYYNTAAMQGALQWAWAGTNEWKSLGLDAQLPGTKWSAVGLESFQTDREFKLRVCTNGPLSKVQGQECHPTGGKLIVPSAGKPRWEVTVESASANWYNFGSWTDTTCNVGKQM